MSTCLGRRLWGAAAGEEAEAKLAAEDEEFGSWKKKYDSSRKTYTRTGADCAGVADPEPQLVSCQFGRSRSLSVHTERPARPSISCSAVNKSSHLPDGSGNDVKLIPPVYPSVELSWQNS